MRSFRTGKKASSIFRCLLHSIMTGSKLSDPCLQPGGVWGDRVPIQVELVRLIWAERTLGIMSMVKMGYESLQRLQTPPFYRAHCFQKL